MGHSSILVRFRRDEGGNFAIMGAIIVAPLLLAGIAAIDTTNLMRTRTNVQQALDASALAVGKRYGGGAPEATMREFGQKYFAANLRTIDPAKVQFNIVLPEDGDMRKHLSATADFTYDSLFGTLTRSLTGKDSKLSYHMVSDIRVKNTVEVALVLDNSGSMTEKGTGSNPKKTRMKLLQTAATQLVDSMAKQAGLMTRIDNPVQFSVVPFAASVNVGNQNANAAWMDTKGLSSVHYENFDVSQPITISTNPNKQLVYSNGQLKRIGKGWQSLENMPYTRFDLFKELKYSQTKPFTSWQGCVEARPGSYNLNDTTPSATIPDTLFVPMFAPDEYDPVRDLNPPQNHWWSDGAGASYAAKQRGIKKYFTPSTNVTTALGNNTADGYKGPNFSCTTTPITPLTDISTTAGLNAIKNAITGMSPVGATNVPEGMAWGWRTISHGEPFTQGRPETERGNDKVIIVLTDGANTYYPYGEDDPASNGSSYSAYGYAGQKAPGYTKTRVFQNTSNATIDLHTQENYTVAMNEHFATLCNNVKKARIIVMTVGLDLDAKIAAEKGQIDALKACSSESRSRRDSSGKPVRLFWNTTGGDLAETFRQIGDELSNLRIVK